MFSDEIKLFQNSIFVSNEGRAGIEIVELFSHSNNFNNNQNLVASTAL
jgi:hypothetical protein